jgi:hypothetical protein
MIGYGRNGILKYGKLIPLYLAPLVPEKYRIGIGMTGKVIH